MAGSSLFTAAVPLVKVPRGLIPSQASARCRVPNLIYIWGPTGSGKSFLAKRLIASRLAYQPEARVRNDQADNFIGEFLDAMRAQRVDEFHRSLGNLDVIVLDDIDGIEGKEALQQELVHLLMGPAMGSSRQVILTSRLPVQQLHTLQDLLHGHDGVKFVGLSEPSFAVRLTWAAALAGDSVPKWDLAEIAMDEDNFYSVRGAVITRVAHGVTCPKG